MSGKLSGGQLKYPFSILRLQPEEGLLNDAYGWSVMDASGTHLADNLPKDTANRVAVSLNLLGEFDLGDLRVAEALLNSVQDRSPEQVISILKRFHDNAMAAVPSVSFKEYKRDEEA